MSNDDLLSLLESLLPYVKYAKANKLPNAAYYAELLESLIWPRVK
jgi:hypothetical protein